jgi:F-type H+-transporting ATPase subunit epsilon
VPLTVDVVSPERVLYTGEADMVVCRTSEGEIAFLPGHVPFLGGFVEVSNDHVIVLSDVAELAESIDVDRARRAKQRAEERVSGDPADEDAQAALQRANTRLEVAGAAEHA